MRTVAPLQVTNLVKSFALFFFLSSIAWFAASYVMFADIRISWLVFIINAAIGLGVGWWWYRRHYHAVLSYDDQGFDLRRGSGQRKNGNWRDFSLVSLVHEGYGKFLVRIYGADRDYVDIPASDLKLPVFDFRFEVMDWVQAGSAPRALGSHDEGGDDGPDG